jgi:hypothetical protein
MLVSVQQMGVTVQLNRGKHLLEYTVSKYKDTERMIHRS